MGTLPDTGATIVIVTMSRRADAAPPVLGLFGAVAGTLYPGSLPAPVSPTP